MRNERYYKSRGFIAQLKSYGPFRADDGIIFGVAKGLANHYACSPALVRLIIVLVSCFVFFWPTIIIYLLAAILMSPEPKAGLNSPGERDVWLQAQLDPNAAMEQLSRRALLVEKRLRRLEDYVTSREYKWLKKVKNI